MQKMKIKRRENTKILIVAGLFQNLLDGSGF